MTSTLSLNYESDSLKCLNEIAAVSSFRRTGSHFHVFSTVFGRSWFASRSYIFYVQFNCLFDVPKRFFTGIALRHTAGKGWNRNDISTMALALQYDCIFHGRFP